MKGYFTLPKAPGLELHYQMQFSVLPETSYNISYSNTSQAQQYQLGEMIALEEVPVV